MAAAINGHGHDRSSSDAPALAGAATSPTMSLAAGAHEVTAAATMQATAAAAEAVAARAVTASASVGASSSLATPSPAVLAPHPPPPPASSSLLPAPPPLPPFLGALPSSPLPPRVEAGSVSSTSGSAAAEAAAAEAAESAAAASAASTGVAGASEPTILYTAVGRKRKQRTSGVWQYFEHFTPTTPGGRNVRCTVMVVLPAQPEAGLPRRTVRCGVSYTHIEAKGGHGGSGTSGMLNHIANKHPHIHAAILESNPRLGKPRKSEGKGSAGNSSKPPKNYSTDNRDPATPKISRAASAVASAPTMPAKDRTRADRLFVLSCALESHEPAAVSNGLGFRLLANCLSPSYAACGTITPDRVDVTISELFAGVKSDTAFALVAQHDSCRRLGWGGPFVSLQVDVAKTHGSSFCTASVSFVPEDFSGLVRLAVGARWFYEDMTESDAETWIRELTRDLFMDICGETEPQNVYLAATIGGSGVGDGPGNEDAFSIALKDMGVPVIICLGSRLNSAVMQSLGATRAFGSSEEFRGGGADGAGGPESCRNPRMLDVVLKAKRMIDVCGTLPAPHEDDVLLDTARAEVDELVVVMERSRVAAQRWTAQHALFDRLIGLKSHVERLSRAFSAGRSMPDFEWRAIREVASILDPALEVVTKINASDGEAGRSTSAVFLAEAINLYANLHQSVVYPAQDIRSAKEPDGPVVSRQVENLTSEARVQLSVLAERTGANALGHALEDAEIISILLDPRFKACGAGTCINGGSGLKLRALTALTAELKKFEGASEPPALAPGATPQGGGAGIASPLQQYGSAGGTAPEVKLSRLEKMRQAQDLALGNSDGRGGGGAGGGSAAGGIGEEQRADEAARELGEYVVDSAGKRQGLLAFWKLHGTETRDSGTGKVVLSARWPHLGLLARLYAGVDIASRQCERHFGAGGVGQAVSRLRATLPPKKIEQMVLVRMNRHLVPEVAGFRRKDAETGTPGASM